MAENPPTGHPTEEPAGQATTADHEEGAGSPAAEDTEAEQAAPPEGEPTTLAPVAPVTPAQPEVPAALPERGQRRITRETHTTTSRSETETTTHETSTTVEDIAAVAPVYAAPASEHPRPVG